MAEAAAQKRCAAHLPEQPGHAFGLQDKVFWHKRLEFLRQVPQDGCRFEHTHRLGSAAVEQRRNFGVGVDGNKVAAKLLALLDVDKPGVVFGTAVTQGQQLFQHHRYFDAIGRA